MILKFLEIYIHLQLIGNLRNVDKIIETAFCGDLSVF